MRSLPYLLVCLLATGFAQAEIRGGHTAESISHDSSLIALVTPVEVKNIKGPGEVWFTKTLFKLDEVIKGPVSTGDSITIYDYSYKQADKLGLEKAQKQKKQLLLFAHVVKNSFASIKGKYILTVAHGSKSAYYMDKDVRDLFTPEFGVLTSAKDLLKRTREQVAAEVRFLNIYPFGKVARKQVEVPNGSKAYKRLYGGSSCFLYLPGYEKPKAHD